MFIDILNIFHNATTLYYKYNATISILSILTAYLCCQISNWIGIAAFALTNQQWIYYSVRICITAIVFVLLIHYVSDITAQLLQKPTRSLMILGFMPFVYYIFDYVTSIYTSLLYSGLEIVGEFLGFVLCLTYLMFLFLYFKEYEANKEAEQRNQIIEMKRVQSEKELEALHRSERAVSILRHDMRHFLLSISSYIENNENEKALDYINEVIHTSDKTALQRYCKNTIFSNIFFKVTGTFFENPRPIVKCPCGSRSTNNTLFPSLTNPIPKLIAVVVFPTPPF